jgi:hypothetical protein
MLSFKRNGIEINAQDDVREEVADPIAQTVFQFYHVQ